MQPEYFPLCPSLVSAENPLNNWHVLRISGNKVCSVQLPILSCHLANLILFSSNGYIRLIMQIESCCNIQIDSVLSARNKGRTVCELQGG